jgi:hypothetical protein
MAFSAAVRLSVVLVLLAVPAEALGASTIRTSSVTGRLVVPAGATSKIRLHCPQSAVALNAAVTRRGAGVVVRRSIPGQDVGSWAFRVAASGSGSRSVSAVVRCVRLRVPAGLSAVRLHVKTRSRPGIPVAAGATETVRLGCGAGWSATGYALTGDAGDTVRLAAVVPNAHGWRFTLENTGSAPTRAGVSARCLRTRVAARRQGGGTAELRFNVTRPSFSTVFPRGGPQIDATGCRVGRFSLAAGGSVDPASTIELLIASPLRERGARWRFGQPREGDRFTGRVVCLSRTSRFR